MNFRTAFFAAACAAFFASSAQAAYVVTVTGTLASSYDNAGIFGTAKTLLNGKVFTAVFNVDETTPGSFHALNTANRRMLVGVYAASPVLGQLTVNGVTRHVQPLQGTIFVNNDYGSVPMDSLAFKASSDNYDNGVYYDDWVDFGVNDYSLSFLSSTAVPETYSYTVPGSLITSGSFRFQNSRDGYLAHGEFNVTGFTITSTAPAVPEPASWAMMIGGLGLAGGAMRQRRPTAAVRFG